MADAVQAPEADESDVRVERKYLLFQIDFSGESLPEGLRPRWSYKKGVPDRPIAVSDYSDYDNPRTLLYWRNKLADNYGEELEDAFQNFAGEIFNELNNGRLNLRHTGSRPYLDLTAFVRSASGYSVEAKDLSNALSLSLARPEALFDASEDRIPDIKFGSLDGILPRENDIIMVLARYPGGQFFQEYLGFITRIEDGSSYGQIDRYEIAIDGISKITKQSDIVRAQAINDQQFLPNIELNESNQVPVMEDQYNDKDVRGIFTSILKSIFSVVHVNSAAAPKTGRLQYSQIYGMDPRAFCPQVVYLPARTAAGLPRLAVRYPAQFGGFQHNFFALITLFLMTIEDSGDIELFPPRKDKDEISASSKYYSELKALRTIAEGDVNQIPADDAGVILSPVRRAVLDHGGQSAFNLMIATGFELFFSHMAKAESILGEIRNAAYYDLFEARDGTLVCRPPRYNKIESTTSETERHSVESESVQGGIDPSVVFELDPATSTWEFNRSADFFIRKSEVIDIPSRTFDDDALESRVDMQLNMPLVGPSNFPSGSYTDPDVLLRFGLKTQGPVTNPNALNASAPKIFSPLILAMVNAPSRTASLRVKDSRRFFVGKTYYLESLDCVALLVTDEIAHAYGSISSRSLGFTMVRRVVRRPIAEIKAGANGTFYEAINMAMCYMDDPPNSELFSPQGAADRLGLGGKIENQLQLMQAKGLHLADALLAGIGKGGGAAVGAGQGPAAVQGGPKVVMFRYLPTILDVAMGVEADVSIAVLDSGITDGAKKEQATAAALDKRVGAAATIEGRMALTYKFILPENQQFYEKGFFGDILPTSQNQRDGSLPAYLDPIAPIIPAGSLNYGPASIGTETLGIWYEGGVLPANPIDFVATPIPASALCEQPQNVRLSQLLVNKLAAIDMALKFLEKPSPTAPVPPNYAGIPQLYYYDGVTFNLFAPGVDPNVFLKALRIRLGPSYDLLSDILSPTHDGTPSALQMQVGTSSLPNELSNSCYRIQGSGGSFWLPAGHFLIKSPSPGSDSLFVRVRSKQNQLLGGNIRITKGILPNEVSLESADPSKYELVIDDGSNGGAGEVIVGKLTRSVPAPGILYFLTPFAEPTIERLMQFPLPIEFGGQVSQATVDAMKQRLKDQPGGGKVFTANNKRITGDAINVSIDYLAAASKSDLEAFPQRYPSDAPINSSVLQGIWKRFERWLVFQTGVSANALSGFKSKDAVAVYPAALKAKITYPGGGKADTDMLCLVYGLNITGENDPKTGLGENRKYASAITSAKPIPVKRP